MVRVADGDRQGIGRIGALEGRRRQQDLDHHLDLRLFGMAGADHRFLDQVGGVLAHRQPAQCRRHQHHAARLAQLQRRTRPGGNKGLFHRRLLGRIGVEHLDDAAMQLDQPVGECALDRRRDGAAGDKAQPVAIALDDAPTATSQARINPDDSHCFRHFEALGQEPDPTKRFVNETETLHRISCDPSPRINQHSSIHAYAGIIHSGDAGMNKFALPPSEWGIVWRRTALILVASTLASWVISNLVMMSLNEGMNEVGTVLALGMPTALGGPILLFLQVRSAQLREANRRLELLASTDWLTGCLNRRAFTTRVSSSLGQIEGIGTLLVIDAELPDLNGYEVIARMREKPALAHTKVVMVTSHNTSSYRQRAFEAGVLDFFTKPIDRDLLRLRRRRVRSVPRGCRAGSRRSRGRTHPGRGQCGVRYFRRHRAAALGQHRRRRMRRRCRFFRTVPHRRSAPVRGQACRSQPSRTRQLGRPCRDESRRRLIAPARDR